MHIRHEIVIEIEAKSREASYPESRGWSWKEGRGQNFQSKFDPLCNYEPTPLLAAPMKIIATRSTLEEIRLL